MVETHRSAAAAASPDGGGRGGGKDGRGRGKRPSASPLASPSPSKRGKAEASQPKENAPAAAAAKTWGPADANVTGEPLLQKLQQPPRAWASMLSQYPQQGGPCELKVQGQTDQVVVNGTHFSPSDKVVLRGGDEDVFGQSGNHAYIFQHPLQDNKVTKAVVTSADNSACTGPTILASGPTASAGENNRVIESALESQSDPNPSDIIPLSGWQAFKDGLKQGILSPGDIKVTLGDYPYYVRLQRRYSCHLHSYTWKRSSGNAYKELHLEISEFYYLAHQGSEMYQEALVKALAKHFDARILILDYLMLCGMSSKFQESLKGFRKDDAPTSSSGADIVGISNKNTFREGDGVEYIGHGSLNSIPRAPAYGSRGKVVLAFGKNQVSKVGDRFNNPITNGNNLGGLCEENCGFFCRDVELRPDSSGGEEVDSDALGKLLIEVISEESKSSKLIVLLKDAESLFTEWHGPLRSELPLGALIIGSQTQAERDKDEEASGSKPEKSFLNNLFPNRISIELPKNEAQLSALKKLLEPDAEILKAKASAAITNEARAEVMREARGNLPPAPKATIVYRNQYLDLWACGRAREPWAEAWRRLPLVLHDADLAEAVEINLPEYVKRDDDPDDLTETISKVLKNHPGPIACLRLDRTACPGPGLLADWMDTLSAKQARELMMVNATRPTDLEFPLRRLRSRSLRSLRSLALGFFGLWTLGVELCDNLSSLRDLSLSGCSFSGQALSVVLYRLPALSSLTIGCCNVTAGCGRQGLTIDSRTLRTLRLWKCTASAITIANAPALDMLVAGVSPAPAPAPGRAAAVSIDLRSAQALRTFQDLALHVHQLRMPSGDCAAVNKLKLKRRRVVVSLPSLQTLGVAIQVCVPHHAALLVDILGGLPRLAELTLWCVDDLSPNGDDEGCRRAWSLALMPPCVTSSLEHLVVRDYRGGAGEVALVRRVLSAAARLVSVTIHPHPTVPRDEAAAVFHGCPIKSKGCTIEVGLHQKH